MSCCEKEWYFTDAAGVEHVATSHYRALQLRKKVEAPNAAIKSRKKNSTTK